MLIKRMTHFLPLLAALAVFSQSCSPQLKEQSDIKTNGFITDNCYQALLEVDADDGAKGLVARRESAYLRAKKAELAQLAVENIAAYCIDSQLKAGIIDKNRKDFDYAGHKNGVVSEVKGLVGGGTVAYVYYTEKNSMMIGYRIFKISLKKKIEEIIQKPAVQRQDGVKQNQRS